MGNTSPSVHEGGAIRRPCWGPEIRGGWANFFGQTIRGGWKTDSTWPRIRGGWEKAFGQLSYPQVDCLPIPSTRNLFQKPWTGRATLSSVGERECSRKPFQGAMYWEGNPLPTFSWSHVPGGLPQLHRESSYRILQLTFSNWPIFPPRR